MKTPTTAHYKSAQAVVVRMEKGCAPRIQTQHSSIAAAERQAAAFNNSTTVDFNVTWVAGMTARFDSAAAAAYRIAAMHSA